MWCWGTVPVAGPWAQRTPPLFSQPHPPSPASTLWPSLPSPPRPGPQANPHLLAVAAKDELVRVYDRRRLSPSGPGSTSAVPLLELAPPHVQLGIGHDGRPKHVHTTSVCFSASGDR